MRIRKIANIQHRHQSHEVYLSYVLTNHRFRVAKTIPIQNLFTKNHKRLTESVLSKCLVNKLLCKTDMNNSIPRAGIRDKYLKLVCHMSSLLVVG